MTVNQIGVRQSPVTARVDAPVTPVQTPAAWGRLLLGLFVTYGLFVMVADRLGSTRGESGVVVSVAVLASLTLAERLLFATDKTAATRVLGLGPPHAAGLVAASGLCVLLLLVLAGVAVAWRIPMRLTADWLWLLPGLLAQAGVAEEALFRAYLFGHLRASRSFWRAAALAMLPFALVHGGLFFTMTWPVAAAALLLSIAIAVPLAHLFELGGHTVWAPALLHTVIQGTLKVIVIPEESMTRVALAWMLASALVPFLALLFQRRDTSLTR